MSNARPTLMALLSASVLVAAGCGTDEKPATSAVPTDTPAAEPAAPAPVSIPAAVQGKYAMKVKAKDTSESGGASSGRWVLTVTDADAFADGPDGHHIPMTPAKFTETQLVLPADPQCPNNDPAPGEGTYEVHASGTSLQFTKVEDPCGDRAFTLSQYRWRRVD